MAPAFTNYDPGHYLDRWCTILVAWCPGRNWAYYAAPHDSEHFAGCVQARAVVPGCRSSSFGDRHYLIGELSRRPDLRTTEAGEIWLAG